jgi:chromosome segregation ATPase
MSAPKGAVQLAEPVGQQLVRELERDPADAPKRVSPPDSAGNSGSLWQDVCGLSRACKEIESQLRQQLRVNQTLEADLALALRRIAEMTDQDKTSKFSRKGQQGLDAQDGKLELDHFWRERQVLAGKVDELGQALNASEQRMFETAKLLDRLRTERDGASVEVVRLEEQFSRAMKVISGLKGKLETQQTCEEEFDGRAARLQELLDAALDRHKSCQAELAETRRALWEIRRSILASHE